jgi:hypothetical protein
VGYHNDARAFKDLAEFIDQFFFLCSIHSFTPILGISPRLSITGSLRRFWSVVYGHTPAKRSTMSPKHMV